MRWQQGRRSSNIEDRRGSGRTPRVSRTGKVGGGAIVLALLAVFVFGDDPSRLLDLMGGGGETAVQQPARTGTPAPNDELADFVSVVLADTEDAWGEIFAASGQRYQAPTLVLYTDVTQSACGLGQAASGPFYCPADYKVYLDLSFLGELKRLGAPGDFAFAYVIAHEVGHHVQNLLGIEEQVRRLRSGASQSEGNALSVRMELQADCFAGVWANHAQNMLERGDVDEGLQAAASVGDDRLQQAAGQRVHPESFTHGTSQQRMQWFSTGYDAGDVGQCDTFGEAGR